MSKAKQLREKFDLELKHLQENCPHIKSIITAYLWAPGHSNGKIKVCLECEKILEHLPDDPQLELTFTTFTGTY